MLTKSATAEAERMEMQINHYFETLNAVAHDQRTEAQLKNNVHFEYK